MVLVALFSWVGHECTCDKRKLDGWIKNRKEVYGQNTKEEKGLKELERKKLISL